jgi:hypothetical protein
VMTDVVGVHGHVTFLLDVHDQGEWNSNEESSALSMFANLTNTSGSKGVKGGTHLTKMFFR